MPIKQHITLHDNFKVKTYTESIDGKEVAYKEYDEQERPILERWLDEYDDVYYTIKRTYDWLGCCHTEYPETWELSKLMKKMDRVRPTI